MAKRRRRLRLDQRLGVVARERVDPLHQVGGFTMSIGSPMEMAAKLAIIAGADILIQPESVAQTIDAVVAGVAEGRISVSRIDAAVRRIPLAKAQLGLQRNAQVDMARVRRVVGDSANKRLSERVASRAITLVRDSLKLLPLLGPTQTPDRRILHLVVSRSTNLGAGTTFAAALGRNAGRVRTVVLHPDDPFVDLARILPIVDSSDVVVLASYMAQQWDQAPVEEGEAHTLTAVDEQQLSKFPILLVVEG